MAYFIDVEPWLSVSTGCTFPASWVNTTRTHDRPNGTDATQPRPNDKEVAQQRSNTEYIGDYENLAYGNFTVYVRGDSLRYKFGLLLRGSLDASETRDKFYMSIEHPLEYVMNLFPPNSIPVCFNESGRSDGKVDEVKVPFMEFAFPPVFKKGGEGKEDTGTNGAIPACKACLTATLLAVIATAVSLL